MFTIVMVSETMSRLTPTKRNTSKKMATAANSKANGLKTKVKKNVIFDNGGGTLAIAAMM